MSERLDLSLHDVAENEEELIKHFESRAGHWEERWLAEEERYPTGYGDDVDAAFCAGQMHGLCVAYRHIARRLRDVRDEMEKARG